MLKQEESQKKYRERQGARKQSEAAVLSPVGAMDLEENPFEVEFNAEYDDDEEEGEEDSDELDFISPALPPPVDDPTNAVLLLVVVLVVLARNLRC